MRIELVLTGLLSLAGLSAPASAMANGPATVRSVQIISGPGGPLGACQLEGAKADASLTVSPSDPNHLTAAWVQAVHRPDGNVFGLNVSTSSSDGGHAWSTPRAVPGLSACTGGAPDYAWDPWVSFDAAGAAYLSSSTGYNDPVGDRNQVYASASLDGGSSWNSPVKVSEPAYDPSGTDDSETVTGDPKLAGRAYLTWSRFPSWIMFSRTDDGGRSWSQPAMIAQAPAGHVLPPGRVVVLSDSSLLLLYADTLASNYVAGGGEVTYLAVRSTDGGQSWSAPVTIAQAPFAAFKPLAVTAAPEDNAYAAWADPGTGQVLVVRSADGRQSWSTPVAVAKEPGAQEAMIAARSDGTLGLTWYDNRNGSHQTNAWFAD